MNEGDYIPQSNQKIYLTELLDLALQYVRELLSKWWLIGFIALLGAGYYYYKATNTPAVYTAKLSFMLKEDTGGGGSFAGLLSQFGLGSTGKKGANLDKMFDLLYSREIIGRALFEKVNFNGKTDYLANHYIIQLGIQEAWRKANNTDLHDFLFTRDSLDGFSRLENSVFQGIKSRISKGNLTHEVTDGDMIILRVESESEFLSYELANAVYQKLSDYYVEKAIEKQKETFDIVKARTDSIEQVLAGKEYRLAKFKDSNLNIFKKQSQLEEDRLQREVFLANSLYQESARNLENARMNLLSSKPFVQTIDLPIYPLTAKYEKPIPTGIRGGLFGGIFGILLVAGLKFVRDLIAKEKLEFQSARKREEEMMLS